MVLGLWFRGCWVWDVGFRPLGSGVWGFGFRAQGCALLVEVLKLHYCQDFQILLLSEMRSDSQEQVPVPAPPPAPNPATAVKASKGRRWVHLLASVCPIVHPLSL